jgi:hypothetical protein
MSGNAIVEDSLPDSPNVTIVRSYLAALESGATGEDLAASSLPMWGRSSCPTSSTRAAAEAISRRAVLAVARVSHVETRNGRDLHEST